MKKTILLLVSLAIATTSCKKGDEPKPDTDHTIYYRYNNVLNKKDGFILGYVYPDGYLYNKDKSTKYVIEPVYLNQINQGVYPDSIIAIDYDTTYTYYIY